MLGSFLVAWSLAAAAGGGSDGWQDTIDRVSSGVVSIRLERVRPFDTDWYANSQATGFVVDAEQGIILTNRHVVSPGPVVAEAFFLDGEEVALEAIYRDPVHDFGFFRYDPGALRHIQPAELELVPGAAEVGSEIRVIGNDAGEKLSILAGTLARLDRPAPRYGQGKYNDFNTFYLQAASSTSGGSSGSPVIDEAGRVVALNAGSNTRAASSFYLPLDRIVRALELVQADQPIARGTLQTTWTQKPFDELRRLGLTEAREAGVRARDAEATGMLVAGAVLPGGTGDGVIREGDILVAVDGAAIDGFAALESYLDDRVGQTVELLIERGGQAMTLPVVVADLHAMTPSSFLEFGRGVLHDLSYQKARSYHQPLGGVFVADNGYVLSRDGVPYRAVITEFAGQEVRDLDAFQTVLSSLPDGQRALVRYHMLNDPTRELVTSVEIDRRWFPVRRCHEAVGAWQCADIAGPGEAAVAAGGTADIARDNDRRIRAVLPALVRVDFDVPYTIDGTRGANYVGPGVIVDAEAGLVVADRNTVPITLGDAKLVFANDLRVPAEVVMVHPFHNVALLRYDPSLIGETPVVTPAWNGTPLDEDDAVWWVGRRADGRPLAKATRVEAVQSVAPKLPSRPRFRQINLDVVRIDGAPRGGSGVLVDKKGTIRALWGSISYDGADGAAEFAAGLPAWLLDEMLAAYREGAEFRDLGVELQHISLIDARDRGLPPDWSATLAAHDARRRVIRVERRAWGSSAAEKLQGGDLLLAVNGEPVTRFREVQLAASQGESARLTVARGGELLELDVAPVVESGEGIERVIMWAGAFLQETPLAARYQRFTPVDGVYVDLRWRGGPAMRFGLRRNARIVEVDGVQTPDLDAFLAAVRDRGHRDAVRLTTVDLDGRRQVVSLKLDLIYWPTRELLRAEGGWTRRELR